MGWLIAAAALLIPPILVHHYSHLAARIGLLLFWLACGGASAYCFWGTAQMERQLQMSHRYELPGSPGRHRIELTPLPQISMRGVLRGGAGILPPTTLAKFKWSFPETVPVTWFSVKEYDEPEPGDTLLFYVDWPSAPPYRLEYEVSEALTDALRNRVLIVTHDRSAKHILEDHGLAILRVLAWVSCLWGILWMIVQGVQERKRRGLRMSGG
jgi:hypothetical protein